MSKYRDQRSAWNIRRLSVQNIQLALESFSSEVSSFSST